MAPQTIEPRYHEIYHEQMKVYSLGHPLYHPSFRRLGDVGYLDDEGDFRLEFNLFDGRGDDVPPFIPPDEYAVESSLEHWTCLAGGRKLDSLEELDISTGTVLPDAAAALSPVSPPGIAAQTSLQTASRSRVALLPSSPVKRSVLPSTVALHAHLKHLLTLRHPITNARVLSYPNKSLFLISGVHSAESWCMAIQSSVTTESEMMIVASRSGNGAKGGVGKVKEWKLGVEQGIVRGSFPLLKSEPSVANGRFWGLRGADAGVFAAYDPEDQSGSDEELDGESGKGKRRTLMGRKKLKKLGGSSPFLRLRKTREVSTSETVDLSLPNTMPILRPSASSPTLNSATTTSTTPNNTLPTPSPRKTSISSLGNLTTTITKKTSLGRHFRPRASQHSYSESALSPLGSTSPPSETNGEEEDDVLIIGDGEEWLLPSVLSGLGFAGIMGGDGNETLEPEAAEGTRRKEKWTNHGAATGPGVKEEKFALFLRLEEVAKPWFFQ